MKPKHSDLEILDTDPFANCKLDRKKDAMILNRIIGNFENGFTLAINGEWGTGKTTFIKMWQKQLEQNDYKTIYLNAWENDFVSEPLICILGELKNVTTSSNERLMKDIINKASVFSKKIIPAVAKGLAKKHLGEEASDLIESVATATVDVFKKEVSEYEKKKKDLIDFKTKLQELVNKESKDKPLIFIIDELDRCRPDYAVEILEKIKHFFSVEGIVFVLSIDKNQLCSSIKGHYGSDEINAEEYLRRFIDIEYTLIEPDAEKFCNYLFVYFDFSSFMQNPERLKYSDLSHDKEMFLSTAIKLASAKRLTLRQTEKLFAYTRLALISCEKNSYLFADLFFLMIYIKAFKTSLYIDIRNLRLTVQELSDELNVVFAENIRLEQGNKYFQAFTSTLAKLLFFYNNEISNIGSYKDLINRSEGETQILTFNSGQIDVEKCARIILYYQDNMDTHDMKLSYLTNMIDLMKLY
jgi:Cdc6-like AAA superfamily ATPase